MRPMVKCIKSNVSRKAEAKAPIQVPNSFLPSKYITGIISIANMTPVILQPESNRAWSRRLAVGILNGALAAGLTNIRVSLQLHKILGLR